MVPFNGLRFVFGISPPLISLATLGSFPPGEAGWWLRYTLPLNESDSVSHLGREDDILPCGGGRILAGTIQMLLFPPQKRHRAGQGRSWIRTIRRALLKKEKFLWKNC